MSKEVYSSPESFNDWLSDNKLFLLSNFVFENYGEEFKVFARSEYSSMKKMCFGDLDGE